MVRWPTLRSQQVQEKSKGDGDLCFGIMKLEIMATRLAKDSWGVHACSLTEDKSKNRSSDNGEHKG